MRLPITISLDNSEVVNALAREALSKLVDLDKEKYTVSAEIHIRAAQSVEGDRFEAHVTFTKLEKV